MSAPAAPAPTIDTAADAPPVPATRALLRRILQLAAPTTALALLQVGAQLVETALAARQGIAALAGWAVLLPFALLMVQMSTGAMGGGVAAAVARALGARRIDEATALVRHALVIALAGGALFALGVPLLAALLLERVAGADAAALALPYALWTFGAGAVPTWLVNTLAAILRGAGRHGLAARALALLWLGYPPAAWALAGPAGFGLVGIGMAFALVSWTAAVAMAWVVWRGGAGFAPTLHGPLAMPLFKRILSVGAIACLMAAIANLTTVLVTAQLRTYGTAAVAAYGISARLEFLVIPVAFGVGSALTALVGHATGAGDWATARRIAWIGGALALAVTGAAGLAVHLAPLTFAHLFTSDAAVAGIAAQALAIIGPAFGGFGIGMAMYFAAMGARRMAWPMAAALSRITLAVGGGWLLAGPLDMGIAGHFWGVALGISVYGVVSASGVRKQNWQGA